MVIILEKSMNSNCCRLKHGTLLIRYILAKRNCILFRNYYIICIGSLLSGTDKAVMFTEGEVALLAVVTFHTWKKRCRSNSVSNFYFGYTFANFCYVTGKFMSQNDWVKMYSVVQNTRDIGTADSGISYFDLNCAFGYFWLFDFLILYVFICYYYCSFHNVCFSFH